jgi:hypothetical protein
LLGGFLQGTEGAGMLPRVRCAKLVLELGEAQPFDVALASKARIDRHEPLPQILAPSLGAIAHSKANEIGGDPSGGFGHARKIRVWEFWPA